MIVELSSLIHKIFIYQKKFSSSATVPKKVKLFLQITVRVYSSWFFFQAHSVVYCAMKENML